MNCRLIAESEDRLTEMIKALRDSGFPVAHLMIKKSSHPKYVEGKNFTAYFDLGVKYDRNI